MANEAKIVETIMLRYGRNTSDGLFVVTQDALTSSTAALGKHRGNTALKLTPRLQHIIDAHIRRLGGLEKQYDVEALR